MTMTERETSAVPGLLAVGEAGTRTVAMTADARATAAAGGLYRADREHDACGVGFIASLKGDKSHSIVENGLQILENLTHRGAVGADPLMGDGAGMLVQIPHAFFSAEADRLGFALPAEGDYAVGHLFMPRDAEFAPGARA